MTISVGAAWRQIRDKLAAAGIDTASLDARLLGEAAFGMDGVRLAVSENEPAGETALKRLDALAERRLAHEPVARILGEKEFYGLGFFLSAETLVPRPETELVVDLACDALKGRDGPTLLDIGTGTGCIAIATLANQPDARAVAVDLSADALETARRNAGRHNLETRIDFRQGSWFAPIAGNERFDVLVSNPPYIVHNDIAGLAPDVSRFDPHLALDGGQDGLDPYRVIANESGTVLRAGGTIVLEHGCDQAQSISRLLARHGFVELRDHKDLAGHERVLVATWPGEKSTC